ncbi:MAG: CRISPR-associated helicase Cas3' [Candidatus Anstonellaceae archaeon]
MENILARPEQKLIEHLKKVREAYNEQNFYKNELEEIAIVLHDIAKVSARFQEQLKSNRHTKFRHPLVALPLVEFVLRQNYKKKNKNVENIEGDILIYLLAIYNHHGDISFDKLQNDIINLSNIIQTDDKRSLEDFNLNDEELKAAKYILEKLEIDFNYEQFKLEIKNEKDYVKRILEILKNIYSYFLKTTNKEKIKFVTFYSKLVEADWKGSAQSDEKIKEEWNELIKKYEQKYEEKFTNKGDKLKFEVFNSFKKNITDKNKSKVFFVAPTGIGKSEISLYWALKQAKEKNLKKIIYVLPFKVLIDDLFKRFKEYLGEENVDKWDSDWIEDDILKALTQEIDRSKNLNLDEIFNFYKINREYFLKSPVIITTADQILSSFFNIRRYPIRLGLFKESAFVFDEIQGYGENLRFFIYRFIENTCLENPVLIMTATPPSEIEEKNKITLLKDFEIFRDKKWWEEIYKKRMVKVKIIKTKNFDIKELKGHIDEILTKKKRIAIIVNTVNSCVEIFKELKKNFENKIDMLILHGSLRSSDRDNAIKRILDPNANPFLLVSTQVIEAGIDVSFDYMIRQIAPYPSLVQSLGRVNRKGEYEDSEFCIIAFQNEEDKKIIEMAKPYDINEIDNVNKKLIAEEGKIKNKKELEQLDIELENKNLEYVDEYSKYMTKLIMDNIWSFSEIESFLGTSLREALYKKDAFIGRKEEWEEIEKQGQQLRLELKEKKDKEILEKYIKFLKNKKDRTISVTVREEDLITEERYKEKYLGEV